MIKNGGGAIVDNLSAFVAAHGPDEDEPATPMPKPKATPKGPKYPGKGPVKGMPR